MVRLLPLLVAGLSVLPAVEADWPQYRGPARSGVSAETGFFAGLKDGPQVLWKSTVGIGFTSPVVVKGRVYAAGNSKDVDTLYCFDAATGKPATGWINFSYPAKLGANGYDGGPTATPTIAGGVLYGLGKDGLAYCLDAATGTLRWSKDLAAELTPKRPDWGFASAPLVVDGRVYLNIGRSGTCLDATSGAVLWKSDPDKAGYAGIVPLDAAGHGLLVFSSDRLLLARAETGAIAWELPWATTYGVNAADPIVHGTQVFVCSGYGFGGGVYDLSGPQPKELWKNKALRTQMSPALLLDGHLYGFDDKTLKCVSWADGAVKWEQKGLGQGTLVAAERRLVILSEKGELVIAEAVPERFTELSRGQVLTGRCWTPPALAGGRVFCRNAKGDLVAVELR